MAITISGQNNNDKILASDGVLDSISGFNVVGVLTATTFETTAFNANHINVGSTIQLGNAGIITATTLVGNVQGNINHTSNLLLQISGSEKFRVGTSGQLGIGGANYGTSGQVLTSGGSGSAATWSTITGTTINNNANNRIITGSGTANTLEAESTVTWDGTQFIIRSSDAITSYNGSKALTLQGGDAAGEYVNLAFNGNGYQLGVISGYTNQTSNNGAGSLVFSTNNSGSINSRLVINQNGHTHPSSDSTYDLGLTGTRWRNVYADTYYGDGSNLTNLPAQATIANNADNRVITGGSGVNLNGEANFTFDNGVADITGKLRIDVSSTSGAGSGNIEGIFLRNLNETDNNAVAIFAGADDYSRAASAINFINTDHSADAGEIQFDTRNASNSYAGRVQIKSSGGLVSSKGGAIPFSDGYSAIEARAPEGTTQLTVTNTTYESGTFDNETGIWFKGNYSGNDERAKSAIIHKNTGDYGVGDLYICLDGNADNSNATVSDVKMRITKEGNVTKPGNAAFHVTGTASGVAVSANGVVKMPYNTETGSSGYFDNGAHYDTGNYRFTAPVAGIYFFYASILNFPSTNSGYFTLVGAKNGSRDYSYGFARFNSANSQTDINFSTTISLSTNDYFEIMYEAANGSNYNYYISGGHGHFFGFLLQ
jgi:hypothetical protein